jgi:GGDEF domain-containing protein
MFLDLRRRLSELIYPEGPQERRGLERRTFTDGLTGLGNKQALEMALPSAEIDPNVSILVFDLNNLGRANKVDGHHKGDALIRRAGRTLKVLTTSLTGQCRAFRFGGDEFVVLTDAAYAAELTEALREGYGKWPVSDGTIVSLSGTYGETFRKAERLLQWKKHEHKQQEKDV